MCDKTSDTKNSLYQEHYNKCYTNIRESEMLIDKNILYLSSGALAVTLGTVSQLSDNSHKYLIISAWVLFVLAILLTFFSFFTSIEAHQKSIIDAENILTKDKETDTAKTYNIATKILSILSFMIFVAGLICTGIYYTINLKEGTQMPNTKTTQLTEGFSAPKIQATSIDKGLSTPKVPSTSGTSSDNSNGGKK
ncbi:hypothetical protein [Seleniivibrio woodruffii]|uniref:hypothetical protein n=1 Tax=Seleniivibrio woodruffii TaxID=1078050 RepID=UPI0026ECD1C8|nr:hypothetical protein [Seleniivibrio woodruffii]